jgi:hypothetical protein
VKATFVLSALLLLVACAAPTPGDDAPARNEFVASDTEKGASEREAKPSAIQPLSAQEQSDAALLISKLEQTADQAERDELIAQLIELGPRFLPFFRNVNRESVLLDMMYVIRRIEGENRPPESVTQDNPERESTGGESPKGADAAPSTDYNAEEVEKYWASLLKQAQRQLEVGRYDAAVRTAEAAIVLRPESRWRSEFDAIIVRARSEGQSELLIAGTMSIDPPHVRYAEAKQGAPFATPLQVHCYLKNVSARQITLRLNEGIEKRSLLQLLVRYEQTDYLGHAMSQQDNVSLPIEAGAAVTLQPGESYELVVPLTGLTSLDADAPLKNALGKAQFDASLRVYGALDGDGNALILRPVRFSRRSVLIFPADFDLDAAKDKPLTYIRDCIDDERAQDLFLAAHLVEPKALRGAGDALTANDFSEGPLAVQRARLRAMTTLFGVGPTWDIRQWREWWNSNRLRDHAKLND